MQQLLVPKSLVKYFGEPHTDEKLKILSDYTMVFFLKSRSWGETNFEFNKVFLCHFEVSSVHYQAYLF